MSFIMIELQYYRLLAEAQVHYLCFFALKNDKKKQQRWINNIDAERICAIC